MQIIITSIIISLFCCGWKTITDEGMILHFIRKAFDGIVSRKLNGSISVFGLIIYQFAKPFILCITCMASFWGIVIYIILYNDFNIVTLICCVISAFLNNVFYYLYEKI